MKHIKTVNKANLKETAAKGGCGRCQTSCQSACKTSCTGETLPLAPSHTGGGALAGGLPPPVAPAFFVQTRRCFR